MPHIKLYAILQALYPEPRGFVELGIKIMFFLYNCALNFPSLRTFCRPIRMSGFSTSFTKTEAHIHHVCLHEDKEWKGMLPFAQLHEHALPTSADRPDAPFLLVPFGNAEGPIAYTRISIKQVIMIITYNRPSYKYFLQDNSVITPWIARSMTGNQGFPLISGIANLNLVVIGQLIAGNFQGPDYLVYYLLHHQ